MLKILILALVAMTAACAPMGHGYTVTTPSRHQGQTTWPNNNLWDAPGEAWIDAPAGDAASYHGARYLPYGGSGGPSGTWSRKSVTPSQQYWVGGPGCQPYGCVYQSVPQVYYERHWGGGQNAYSAFDRAYAGHNDPVDRNGNRLTRPFGGKRK